MSKAILVLSTLNSGLNIPLVQSKKSFFQRLMKFFKN